MCQIFSFHGNCTVRNGRDKKKSLQLVGVTQPITHVCFFLFSPFLSTFPPSSPFLPVIHSSLSPSFHLNLSLLLCLYLSVSVASRHRAGVLTCASNTWASLLIRLRSVLREIPSTYTRSHIHTSSHTHTNTAHSHTHTHTNWQTAKPPRSGLSELFSLRWWICVNVYVHLRSYMCVCI